MAPKPPVFKLPPPKSKRDQSTQAVFKAYINAHPELRQWAQGIYQNARAYGLDPLRFAQLIYGESRGNPRAISSAGAIGLGQIMPSHVGEATPWNPSHRITEADLHNAGFNLRYAAYYFGRAVAEHGGNYEAAYRGAGPNDTATTYNRGYTGQSLFAGGPKGYVPTTTAQSPEQAASRAVETGAAKATITDPWVVVTKNGGLRFVQSDAPPKGVVTSAGLPVRRSEFMTAWRSLNDVYFSYTGHQAPANAVAGFLRSPVSTYALENRLSELPGFKNSPVFKSAAPGYDGIWRGVMGQNVNPDPEMLRYAIVHNLGQAGFEDLIRRSKQYVSSNEFKTNVAGLTSIYQTIFGNPDDAATATIKDAAIAGWSADQFAGYLRARPEYKSSPEYETKRLSFLDALGVFGGGAPILTPGNGPANPTAAQQAPPVDKRIPGNQGVNTPVGGLTTHG